MMDDPEDDTTIMYTDSQQSPDARLGQKRVLSSPAEAEAKRSRSSELIDKISEQAALCEKNIPSTKGMASFKAELSSYTTLVRELIVRHQVLEAEARHASQTNTEMAKRMEEGFQMLQTQITSLFEAQATQATLKPTSYAGILRGPRKPKTDTRPIYAVEISMEQSPPEGIITVARKTMDPRKPGFKPPNLKKLAANKAIVEHDTAEARDEHLRSLQSQTIIKASNPQRRRRVIILKGIRREGFNSDEATAKIVEHFNCQEDEAQKVFESDNRNPNLYNLGLEVSDNVFNQATEAGRVPIYYQMVHVEAKPLVSHCRSCLGYGHSATKCRNIPITEAKTKAICSFCGGTHKRGECEAKVKGDAPSCTNCVKEIKLAKEKSWTNFKPPQINHEATSPKCPIYKRKLAIAEAASRYL